MSNKFNSPIEIQNEISGGYIGFSGGFASGTWMYGGDENYIITLRHLCTVLKSIPETESDYWGHKGFFVNNWMHHGVALESNRFDTLESFLKFLTSHNIPTENLV